MRQWYYIQSGERRGPVPEQELREMFEMARLAANAPVWTEGLDGWRPACDLKGLVPVSHTPPPPPPPRFSLGTNNSRGNDTPTVPQERPWVRLWARLIDQNLICLVLGIILSLLCPPVQHIHWLLLGILLLFAYVFIEPAMFAVWGTTPGKALLRVSVRNRQGGRLSYTEALNRMTAVYLRGEGLGIPLVNLLTMDRARQRLKKEGITSWDEDGDITVSHDRIGVWRTSLAVILCLLILLPNVVVGELLMLRDENYLGNLIQPSLDEGTGPKTAPYPAAPSQPVMLTPALPQGAIDSQPTATHSTGSDELTYERLVAETPPQGAELCFPIIESYAKKGSAGNQYALGMCYRDGWGTEKNDIGAYTWFCKAAQQGHAKAQYQLGVCYKLGKGVQTDDIQAATWFSCAAQQGILDAQYALGLCYSAGCGVQRDESQAANWFWNAAQHGHPDAQYEIALCYQYGHGVNVDYIQAYMWLDLARTSSGYVQEIAKQRNDLAQNLMTPEQVVEAKRLSASFIPKSPIYK